MKMWLEKYIYWGQSSKLTQAVLHLFGGAYYELLPENKPTNLMCPINNFRIDTTTLKNGTGKHERWTKVNNTSNISLNNVSVYIQKTQ